MNIASLRELTRDELVQRRRDLEDELFNLNMRRSLKSLDNPLRLRTVRRDIARILTVLHEDEQGIRPLAQSRSSVLDGSKKTNTNAGAGE
ncbi:50S ribosomal protein L29 [bacterium]|nr:50S ribosomal protein L29 [bacterium]MCB2202178.1 50S ribosomal protein L29 [bacterium]